MEWKVEWHDDEGNLIQTTTHNCLKDAAFELLSQLEADGLTALVSVKDMTIKVFSPN